MLIETKTYTDGTRATGAAPMPDLSPRQQEFVGMLDDVLESLRRGRVALEWSNQLDQVANVVRSMDQVREAIARIKCTPEQPAAEVSDAQIDRIYDRMFPAPLFHEDRVKVRKFVRAILALRPQAVPMTCAWTEDDGTGSYWTACGNAFQINDGGPEDNGMKFCCYCGGGITAPAATDATRGAHIKATMFHDAGAYAECGACGRYSDDPKTLSDRQPVCDCGKQHYWSGSFKPPGPDAKWSNHNRATAPAGGEKQA